MSIDWDVVAAKVSEGVSALAPIAETLAPEAAPAISIITKIITGLAAAEPTALAFVRQVQSGTPLTSTQLQQYYESYKTDDDAFKAELDKQIGK